MDSKNSGSPDSRESRTGSQETARQKRRSFLKGVGVGGAVAGALTTLPASGALATPPVPQASTPAARRKAAVAREPKAVTYESIDNIALITINRPEQKNRLNIAALELLHDAWVRFNRSDDRCAVITGKGNDDFSWGGEPDEMTVDSIAEELHMFYRAMPGAAVKLNKPLIGAAAGTVLGGGFTLATMTDMLIAAENTTFTYPEAHANLANGLIGSLAVRIPHKIAMQIILTGKPLSVQRAYDVGFVNEIVPVGKQVEVAMQYARHIADNGPLVVSWFKNLVDRTLPKGPGEITGALLGELQSVLDSEDVAEFLAAYKTGRKPQFRGR